MAKQELWLDYSFARPSVANMKALGYEGVMRYLSLDPAKNLTKAEAAALRAAGLKIGLVWETTADRAKAGRAAGVADAHAANRQADALGYPKHAVIFYAVDFDGTPAQVKAYFEGAISAGGRPVGLYGGIGLTGIQLASYNWQTVAWSDGKVDGKANLYQRLKPTVKGAPAGTDENVLLNPFPAWGTAAPAPAPAPRPTPHPKSQCLEGYFYNLREGRKQETVAAEITAILDEKPAFFGVCEAVGYNLPRHRGYVLVRDRSKESRADVALYVSKAIGVKRVEWVDLHQTWNRTDHPGVHPPRSFVQVVLGNHWRVVVQHPAPYGPNIPVSVSELAQAEQATRLKKVLAPWLHRGQRHLHPFAKRRVEVVIGDFNATVRSHRPANPRDLAAAIGGTIIDPNHIDTGVVRNAKVVSHDYPTHIGSVKLRSDHKHALRVTIQS